MQSDVHQFFNIKEKDRHTCTIKQPQKAELASTNIIVKRITFESKTLQNF